MTSANNYLMVLPVQHFRVGISDVAVEGPFAEHLRMMRERLGKDAMALVIASPAMDQQAYESKALLMSVINEDKETIRFATLFSENETQTPWRKLLGFLPVMRKLYALTKNSSYVHSGLSWNLWLPFEFAAILFGILLQRRTIFVVDIDYRNSAAMSYRTGDWSWKSYAACRYVYDTARSLQLRIAAKYCSLVLLKGRKLVTDFGTGQTNVQYMLDSAHSKGNIIDTASLQKKIDELSDPAVPLRLTYFGRFTAYKGIDRCLRAVAMAKKAGANVQLDIIGNGEETDALQRLSTECDADAYVHFLRGLPFNQDFFQFLFQYHLLLAAPLREDTPRSALDAMAAGIPYLAFATYYYRELLESGAGRTVPWLDVEGMAQAIVELDRNRHQLITMMQRSVQYATDNTQEIWLERRLAWTLPRRETTMAPSL